MFGGPLPQDTPVSLSALFLTPTLFPQLQSPNDTPAQLATRVAQVDHPQKHQLGCQLAPYFAFLLVCKVKTSKTQVIHKELQELTREN